MSGNNINSAQKGDLLIQYHRICRLEEKALEDSDFDALACSRIELAKVLVKTGAFQEALAKNLQAEAHLKGTDNVNLLSECWRCMAIIYGYLENHEKRIQFNLLCLDLLKNTKDELKISKVLNNLGSCYLDIGSFKKALPLFLTNLEKENLSDDLYAVTKKNLGVLYLEIGQLEKAEDCFQKTLEFSKSKGMFLYESAAWHYLGQIAYQQSKFELAYEYAGKALKGIERINLDKKVILDLLENRVKLLIDLGKYDELKSTFVEYVKLNKVVNKKVVEQSNKSIGFLYEILEKKKEQALLKERNDQLKTHNQELKQFAHIVSHDLKQPIRTVNSFAGLLKKEIGEDLSERAKDFYEIISSSCKEMISFVDSVLRFAESNATKPFEVVDCNEIMRMVKANLNAQLKETNGQVVYKDLPAILGYKSELLQVFQNIVSNGLKFRHKERFPVVTITTHKDRRNWVFKIKDNGIGIRKEDKKRIFNMFERLDSNLSIQGSGIGLSTVLKIVKRFGGQIDLESQPGEGSVFLITIPNYSSVARVS